MSRLQELDQLPLQEISGALPVSESNRASIVESNAPCEASCSRRDAFSAINVSMSIVAGSN